jgi:altronate dehydratase small subunit
MKVDAIKIRRKDNVATVLRDVGQEEKIVIDVEGQKIEMVVREAFPYGHKFSTVDIARGEKIYKYGEVIGRATDGILAGFHVHIHNVESLRGRGDIDI